MTTSKARIVVTAEIDLDEHWPLDSVEQASAIDQAVARLLIAAIETGDGVSVVVTRGEETYKHTVSHADAWDTIMREWWEVRFLSDKMHQLRHLVEELPMPPAERERAAQLIKEIDDYCDGRMDPP